VVKKFESVGIDGSSSKTNKPLAGLAIVLSLRVISNNTLGIKYAIIITIKATKSYRNL